MKQLKYIIGFAISAVALWFVLKDIDYSQVGKAFAEANYGWLALAMVPFSIVMLLKAYRHKTLFWPLQNVSFHNIFGALMMSYLFNTILPARLGEVVRAYAITRRQKIPIGRTFSTVLLEKILDVITLFAFMLGLLITHTVRIDPSIRNPAILISGVIIAGFVIAMIMAWKRAYAEKFIAFVLRPIPAKFGKRIYHLAEQVLDSLEVLIHWRVSLWIWVQSVAIWAVTALSYLFWGYAMHLPAEFGLGMAIFVMFTSNMAMVIPSTPGYVGVLEAATIVPLLAFFPNQRDLLTSYAFLTHIAGFLPVVVVGAFYSWREGVSLGEVKREQEEINQHPDDEGIPAAPVAEMTAKPEVSTMKTVYKPGIVTSGADGSTDSIAPMMKPRSDASR